MLYISTKNVVYLCYIVIATYTILINKWLLIIEQVPVVYLTLFQFIVSCIGLVLMERFNKISIKSVHPNLIIVPSFLFCCFVLFMNYSLLNNSLVIYQLSKIIISPILILIQCCIYKRKQSFLNNTSLVGVFTIHSYYLLIGRFLQLCVLFGAAITIYYDQNLYNDGALILFMAVVCTIFYKLIIKLKQSELQMDNLQFLYYYAPLSAIILIVYIFVCETPYAFFYGGWTYLQMYLIFAACMFAFINSLVINWVISNTSTFTYITLIQIKLFLVLSAGYLLFEEELNFNQFFGLFLTILGSFVYSYLKDKNRTQYKIIYSY